MANAKEYIWTGSGNLEDWPDWLVAAIGEGQLHLFRDVDGYGLWIQPKGVGWGCRKRVKYGEVIEYNSITGSVHIRESKPKLVWKCTTGPPPCTDTITIDWLPDIATITLRGLPPGARVVVVDTTTYDGPCTISVGKEPDDER